MKLRVIEGQEIESVRCIDFIVDSDYRAGSVPGDPITTYEFYCNRKWPFLHSRERVTGTVTKYTFFHFVFAKGEYYVDEDYVKKHGRVIHDGKVCYPPEVEITLKSGRKHHITCESFEHANELKAELSAKMKNPIEI